MTDRLTWLQGRICYEHGGIPATACRNNTHKWVEPYVEPEEVVELSDNDSELPAGVGNFNQMIRREGNGFDAPGGTGDPLVQEPKR